jgi:molybdopterin synthase catalytic subunit
MANSVCEVLLTEELLEGEKRDLAPSLKNSLNTGAVIDFWGVVRGTEDGRQIDGIEYEAHREMAEHQLKRIAQQAGENFALQSVVIHHRIGFVPAGEPSLFLRATSRHRAEAFKAGQWIVDELKKKVPIWKRPRFKAHDPAGSMVEGGSASPKTMNASHSEAATVK